MNVVTREEMSARKEEWLAKKEEIQAGFADRVEDPLVGSAVGLSLIGAGAGSIIVNLLRHRRSVFGYLVGVAFVLLGVAALGGSYRVRSDRISDAEEQVRAQLSALDPIARAQVLKSMATEQAAPFIHHGVQPN